MKLVDTQALKEETALAILLWQDFKCQGKFDPEIITSAIKMVQHYGCEKEYNELQSKLRPMKITLRDQEIR